MTFDVDERVAIYLEAFFCNLNLKSFNLGVIANFDGDESEGEKMAKFTTAEAKSQKVGLRVLTKKNNIGEWQERAEIILINRGRKDYFDLLQPYLAKNAVRILEKNDALGIQLIDYGNGLLKVNDSIGIELGVTITISKKNNMDIFNARLAALELALENRLINVPANTLLGRDTTTGTVQAISQSRFATPQQLDQAIIDLIGGAPGALNTLVELAAALNNDNNFASNIINQLTTKAPLSNPNFSGTIITEGRIAFPSVQIPSNNPNILDDYLEGFWNPTIAGLTTVGTATYSTRQGSFTKIGRRVFVECFIEWTGHDGTGNLSLSGLPYLSAITNTVSCWHRNLSLNSNCVLQTYIPVGQSIVVFKQITTGVSAENNVPIDVAAGIMISGSYLTIN
jgi:hypothetical protein